MTDEELQILLAHRQRLLAFREQAREIKQSYLRGKVGIPGLTVERLMEEICSAWWRTRSKAEKDDFLLYMRQLRDAQRNDKAMGELVLHKGERPEDLSQVIGFVLDNKEWARDNELLHTFYKVFRIGALNTTSKATR